MDIEDACPLQREAFIEDIWPWLKICKKKRKPDFRNNLKLAFHREMGIKVSRNVYSKNKEEEDQEELFQKINKIDKPKKKKKSTENEKEETELSERLDPFLQLGYGINAHIDTLLSMSCFFVTVTLAVLPILYCYNQNDIKALITQEANPFAQLSVFSLGNMGGSSMFCAQKRIATEVLEISCPRGSVPLLSKVRYGVFDTKLERNDYCIEEAIWAHEKKKEMLNCSQYVDRTYIDG